MHAIGYLEHEDVLISVINTFSQFRSIFVLNAFLLFLHPPSSSRSHEVRRVDVTAVGVSIIKATEDAAQADQRLTAQKVIERTFKKSSSSTITSQIDFEFIIARMILEQFLKEDFHFTAYATISYLIPGPRANWLKRGGDAGKFFVNLKTTSKKSAASHSAIVPKAVEDGASPKASSSSSPVKKSKPTLAPNASSAGTKNHVKTKKTEKNKTNGSSKSANGKEPKAPEIEEPNFVLLESDSE